MRRTRVLAGQIEENSHGQSVRENVAAIVRAGRNEVSWHAGTRARDGGGVVCDFSAVIYRRYSFLAIARAASRGYCRTRRC